MLNQANACPYFTNLANKLLMAWAVEEHNSKILNTNILCTRNAVEIDRDWGIDIDDVLGGGTNRNLVHIKDAGRG